MSSPTGSFKRVDRLLRRQEFRYVMRHGKAVHVEGFVVLVATHETTANGERTRLGITASRRTGNATTRNRVKRRVREWFRHERSRMKLNLDIVVIARRTAAKISQCETIQVLNEAIRAVGALV